MHIVSILDFAFAFVTTFYPSFLAVAVTYVIVSNGANILPSISLIAFTFAIILSSIVIFSQLVDISIAVEDYEFAAILLLKTSSMLMLIWFAYVVTMMIAY